MGAQARDAFDFLVTTDKNATKALGDIAALSKKVDALAVPELTDAQVSALAAAVAASPTLAERIAEHVAAKLAERIAN